MEKPKTVSQSKDKEKNIPVSEQSSKRLKLLPLKLVKLQKSISFFSFCLPSKYGEAAKGDLIELIHKMNKNGHSIKDITIAVRIQMLYLFLAAIRFKLNEVIDLTSKNEISN